MWQSLLNSIIITIIFFFIIPFYLQSVLVHSANCVKTCIQWHIQGCSIVAKQKVLLFTINITCNRMQNPIIKIKINRISRKSASNRGPVFKPQSMAILPAGSVFLSFSMQKARE
jgi:hypothetical protein